MKKTIFLFAILILLVLIFGPLLLNIFNVEFDNKSLEDSFNQIRFWGIPFCILMTLFGTINPNETPRGRMVVVILILGISLIAFIFMVMFNWGGGCDWTNRKVLYVNAENKAIKVVVRENGYGALGSSVVKSLRSDFDQEVIKGIKVYIEKLKYYEDCIKFDKIIDVDFVLD